ncbi:MAG: heme anaerobic degradation radical SAM methyltransferase ChuW/HutW, partial [Sutterellaceae bacterium]|nr:heme anaerobic degradation radical SAM methyltransferase ChuW/HutW [Sutterellaceae bacterium]
AYFHVPFCETRCLYCMFYQNPLKEDASHAFAQRLIKEIQLWSDKEAQKSGLVHAVYFGGGTPTALAPQDMKDVLKAVKTYLPLANDCEITLEGRIHHFEDEKMEAALEGGVNRFSLGAQTFNTQVRQSVQRVDDRETMIRRLEKLCSYDDAAVVIDLIYGFPGQTMEVWEDDLKTAMSLPLDGVDCYQLNVFEKSPLAKYIANGKLPSAADTAMKADMFAKSVEMLTNNQWHRLSNNHWRQTNRERNIYNELGKSACDCLAFGCGAGGRLNGHSFMMQRKLADWNEGIDAGRKPVMVVMAPGEHWHLLRTVSSQMELGAINLKRIAAEFGVPVDTMTADVVAQWIEAGLLTRVGDWLVQTLAGQYWHVTLAQLLVDLITKRLSGEKIEPQGASGYHGSEGGHPHAMMNLSPKMIEMAMKMMGAKTLDELTLPGGAPLPPGMKAAFERTLAKAKAEGMTVNTDKATMQVHHSGMPVSMLGDKNSAIKL